MFFVNNERCMRSASTKTMATHNNQHTDLNSENTGSLALDLRENFRAAIDPSRPPPIELATLSQELLLFKQTLASYADIALGAGGKEQNDRNVHVAHAGMANIQNNIALRQAMEMRDLRSDVDNNLGDMMKGLDENLKLATQGQYTGDGLSSLARATTAGREILDTRQEIANLDKRSIELRAKITQTMEDVRAHNLLASEMMDKMRASNEEVINTACATTDTENKVLEEIGLKRADIKYFSYRDPNQDEFLVKADPYGMPGQGDNFGAKVWYEVSLTDKDGNIIPLTDEQRDALRTARQEFDLAKDLNGLTRKNAFDTQGSADRMSNKLEELRAEVNDIQQKRRELFQDIRASESLNRGFATYAQTTGAQAMDHDAKIEYDTRRALVAQEAGGKYAAYTLNKDPLAIDENGELKDLPCDGGLMKLYEQDPDLALGAAIGMYRRDPEKLEKLYADNPELKEKLVAHFDNKVAHLPTSKVLAAIQEHNGQAPADLQAIDATAQTANLPEITRSGIATDVTPRSDFSAASNPAIPEAPAPLPDMPEIQRQQAQAAPALM